MPDRTEVRDIRFAFIRHAMSVDNEAWRLGLPWPGIRDAPLCDRGRAHLPGIATQLVAWRPDVVVSSPLTRCIETAKAISAMAETALEIDYALTEVHHTDGDLPLSPELLASLHPGVGIPLRPTNPAADDSVAARAIDFILGLADRNERRVCVVGHRGWLMAAAGLDLDNGEVACLHAEFQARDKTTIPELKSIRRVPSWW